MLSEQCQAHATSACVLVSSQGPLARQPLPQMDSLMVIAGTYPKTPSQWTKPVVPIVGDTQQHQAL